jgi:hypothetical protein
MNPSPPNPFTGLKGALAGLMSGGWLGLLLGLLFRRRIAPMLAALESLFAQWQAGTLPRPVAPAVPVRAASPVRPRARRARRGGLRVRRRALALRPRPAMRVAIAYAQHAADHSARAYRHPRPPPWPPRLAVRCTGNVRYDGTSARPLCYYIVIIK